MTKAIKLNPQFVVTLADGSTSMFVDTVPLLRETGALVMTDSEYQKVFAVYAPGQWVKAELR